MRPDWAPTRWRRSSQGSTQSFVPALHYARGSYFSVTGTPAFSRLIYPVPEPGGLGVHLTLDLAGGMRFGPDVEWIDGKGLHASNPRRADHFYGEIRKYWPALADGSLQPDLSGIRPKLAGPGAPAADFVIQGPETHGVDKPRQSLRHREPRAHLVAGDCRRGRAPARAWPRLTRPEITTETAS